MPTTIVQSPARSLPPSSPRHRDLPIDALRAAAVGVVVVGHAIVAAVAWRDGRPVADNLLATSAFARGLTWVFQVLPLVFLCGGVAAASGAGRPGWLAARVERLVAPVTAYLAVVAAALVAAWATGLLDGTSVGVVGRALVMHLWFLAAFVLVTALVPALLVAGRRFGWRAVPAALALIALVDAAASRLPVLGWINLALVWGLCTHLGVLRWLDTASRAGGLAAASGAGGLARAWPGGRRGAVLTALAALSGLVGLVCFGGYPVSMVGVPGAPSNADPPTLALALLGLAQAAAFSAVTERWRPRRPGLLAAANRMAMGAYLWQFAGIVLAAALLLPAGILPVPPTGSWAWWAWRPVWVAACLVAVGAVLFALGVRATGRPAPGRPGPKASAAAAAAAVAGFVLVTTSGITASSGFVAGAALLAVARLAARGGGRPRPDGPRPQRPAPLAGKGMPYVSPRSR